VYSWSSGFFLETQTRARLLVEVAGKQDKSEQGKEIAARGVPEKGSSEEDANEKSSARTTTNGKRDTLKEVNYATRDGGPGGEALARANSQKGRLHFYKSGKGHAQGFFATENKNQRIALVETELQGKR